MYPWDYRTAELGNNILNITTLFIDFFACIGWAHALKTVPKEIIEKRAEKTGDGTNLWGSEDEDNVTLKKKQFLHIFRQYANEN